MILEQYVDRMNSKDAPGISRLFAEDCHFSDGGGRPWGHPDIVLDGREAVENLFAGILTSNDVKSTIVKLNPSSMEYDVQFGDTLMPCIGLATLNEQGLILEYIVRPR